MTTQIKETTLGDYPKEQFEQIKAKVRENYFNFGRALDILENDLKKIITTPFVIACSEGTGEPSQHITGLYRLRFLGTTFKITKPETIDILDHDTKKLARVVFDASFKKDICIYMVIF